MNIWIAQWIFYPTSANLIQAMLTRLLQLKKKEKEKEEEEEEEEEDYYNRLVGPYYFLFFMIKSAKRQ